MGEEKLARVKREPYISEGRSTRRTEAEEKERGARDDTEGFMSEQVGKGRMEQNLKEKTIFLQYTQKRYRTKLSAAGAKRDTKIHKKKGYPLDDPFYIRQ